eukprot:356186-Chlamydomonas_euryale.AAC.1
MTNRLNEQTVCTCTALARNALATLQPAGQSTPGCWAAHISAAAAAAAAERSSAATASEGLAATFYGLHAPADPA